jgi:hypothetical protein
LVEKIKIPRYSKEKINNQEIIKIINNLKDDTATGFDGVSVKTLKAIATNIIKPLTYIYNLSISECIFPCRGVWFG